MNISFVLLIILIFGFLVAIPSFSQEMDPSCPMFKDSSYVDSSVSEQRPVRGSSRAEVKTYSLLNYINDKTEEISLTDSSKSTAILFLSSKCPCSNSHIEHITELVKLYPQMRFIGIHSNVNESKENSLNYFKTKKLNFPVYRDVDAAIANSLGAVKTPHVYVLNTKGIVVYAGGVTDSPNEPSSTKKLLKIALAQLLSGKAIDPNETRILGCSIQRTL